MKLLIGSIQDGWFFSKSITSLLNWISWGFPTGLLERRSQGSREGKKKKKHTEDLRHDFTDTVNTHSVFTTQQATVSSFSLYTQEPQNQTTRLSYYSAHNSQKVSKESRALWGYGRSEDKQGFPRLHWQYFKNLSVTWPFGQYFSHRHSIDGPGQMIHENAINQ